MTADDSHQQGTTPPVLTTTLRAHSPVACMCSPRRSALTLPWHACAHHGAPRLPQVRSVVTLLWPRAQVKPFGSFATGLMRPGSDIDLVVTLPPVRTTTSMPEAPGTL